MERITKKGQGWWSLIRKAVQGGMTPGKVAVCVALGLTISVFPVVGAPTIICTALALVFRLNLPLLQAVNWSTGPLQYILIVPFLRLGERVVGAEPLPLSGSEIVTLLREDATGFLSTFSASVAHAATGWLLVGPAVMVILYLVFSRVFRAMTLTANRTARRGPGFPARG